MDDEATIRQLVADRTTAMRAGDAATICHAYAPDAIWPWTLGQMAGAGRPCDPGGRGGFGGLLAGVRW